MGRTTGLSMAARAVLFTLEYNKGGKLSLHNLADIFSIQSASRSFNEHMDRIIGGINELQQRGIIEAIARPANEALNENDKVYYKVVKE